MSVASSRHDIGPGACAKRRAASNASRAAMVDLKSFPIQLSSPGLLNQRKAARHLPLRWQLRSRMLKLTWLGHRKTPCNCLKPLPGTMQLPSAPGLRTHFWGMELFEKISSISRPKPPTSGHGQPGLVPDMVISIAIAHPTPSSSK